jgi:hypothetical protein
MGNEETGGVMTRDEANRALDEGKLVKNRSAIGYYAKSSIGGIPIVFYLGDGQPWYVGDTLDSRITKYGWEIYIPPAPEHRCDTCNFLYGMSHKHPLCRSMDKAIIGWPGYDCPAWESKEAKRVTSPPSTPAVHCDLHGREWASGTEPICPWCGAALIYWPCGTFVICGQCHKPVEVHALGWASKKGWTEQADESQQDSLERKE